MKEINIKGDIISDSLVPIYEWYEIPHTCAKNVINSLKEANGEPIRIKINSGGGSVFSASEIYTELINYKGEKIVEIQGMAGSSASIIAMAGDKIFISPVGQIMIHNASLSNASGNKNDLEHTKNILNNIDDTIANAYILKTGLSRETILEMMNKETWFTPQQAKELNFVDEIINMPDIESNYNFHNSLYNSYSIMNKVNVKQMEEKRKMDNNIAILENQLKQSDYNQIENIQPIKKGLYLGKNESFENRISEESRLLKNDINLGDVIRGIVTGKMNDTVKNSINTTVSGVLIPEVLSSQVLDLARNNSLFASAGVPIIPMETNNLVISRIKKDAEFSFKQEGEEGKEASLELDSISLDAKTIYGYAYITLEAINSSQNLDSIVKQAFSKAIANSIDLAFLYGQNGEDFAPSGIMNDSEIESIESRNRAYDDFIRAKSKIRQNNGIVDTYAINSYTEEQLELLKDSNGNYIEMPKCMEGIKRVVTNQLKHNDEDNTNHALIFDSSALLIGIQQNLRIKIMEDTECLKRGLVAFQIYAMLDCKVVNPKSVVKIANSCITNAI